MKRVICAKCGRKRYVKHMVSDYWSVSIYSYNSNWRCYPNKRSYVCGSGCNALLSSL